MWVARQIARRSQRWDWRSYFLIGCVALLALLLAGASLSAVRSAERRDEAELWQVHTLEVLLEADRLRSALLGKMRGERGYLLTGDETFLQPYFDGLKSGRESLDRLIVLTADNPLQQRRFAELEADFTGFDDTLRKEIAMRRSGGGAEAIESVRRGIGKDYLDEVLTDLEMIEETERALLIERTREANRLAVSNERYQYALTTLGFLLLFLAFVAVGFVRRARLAEEAARRDLERTASTDALTGLPNRRSFIDALRRSLDRVDADRERKMSLAIFDLDHFKQINDRFGHPGGDEVIREVAERAHEALRNRDFIGRIGGEEFAVILPLADVSTAHGICERLRESIARRPVVHGDSIIPFTTSVGIAEYRRGDDLDRLMARADAALYEAKRLGRNQVRRAA